MNDRTINYYYGAWAACLKGVLHWNEGRIQDWVAKNWSSTDDLAIMVTERPSYWLLDLLIPEELEVRLGRHKALALRRAVHEELLRDERTWAMDVAYDWQTKAQKIAELLVHARHQ